MVSGNGGPSGPERVRQTYERVKEKHEEATSPAPMDRALRWLGAVLVWGFSAFVLAAGILGALALLGALWRAVRWGFSF